MSGSWRPWYGYLIVILAQALLVGTLILVDPVITMGRYPMVYIVVVMLSAYLLGEGPAILSLLLGWVAFTHLFLPPQRFWPLADSPEGWAAQMSYILGTFIVGFAATIVRRSRQRVQQLVSVLNDEIEDRKAAEKALQEVERDLSRAQFVAQVGSWRLDTRRDELVWSDETYRIFGIEKGTPLTYEAFLDRIHPDDREYVDRKWKAAMKGEHYDIDHRICDGEHEKWIRETAEVEFDEEGVLLGGFGTAQDITDRKRAEIALDEDRRRTATVARVAEAGISTLNTQDLFDLLVTRIREGMSSTAAILFTYDQDSDELVARSASNLPELVGLRVPSEESFVGLIRKESRMVYVADASTDPLVVSERIKQAGLRSVLGAPLAVGGRFLGVICVAESDVREYSPEEVDLFETMAGRASLAVENAKLYGDVERSRAELQQALDVESYLSRQLQRALLPPKPEIGEGYHVAHKYIPAYANREIGGDFYDVFRAEDGKIAIVIGDVSGKGLEAASMAAITRATVHAFAYEFSQAGKALTHANSVISAQQETGQISFFVTVFVTILDPATGEATYSSAGHPPPAIWHADTGEVGFLELGNPPVGVIARYEFGEGTYRLDPGDRIVFYTDGLSEARRGTDLFEIEGIGRVLREHGSKPPDEVIGELASAATAWGNGHLSDDTAIVVIERE